jgi:hypothetical protein
MSLFTVSTFRTAGAAAVTQNLFALWNGSDKSMQLLELLFQMDCTAVLTSVMPLMLGVVVNIAAPTTGSNPATNHYFVQCLWQESRD